MAGKRARRAMRRTASMAQLGPDPGSPAEQHAPPRGRQRGMTRSSGDLVLMETAQFLKTCGLCNRLLGPGRDTFMYRGDIAFCSLECRQQQMSQDERKEKCSLTSMKKDSAGPPGTGSEASAGSGTVATA